MEEYLEIIKIINSSISNFNNLIKGNIGLLDLEKIKNDTLFTNLKDKTWKELSFPNATKRGVYFIFGRNLNSNANNHEKYGTYIGKASFSSSIGNRLYSHLEKGKIDNKYFMLHLNEDKFDLEYVYGLDLETNELEIFSCALEEFLITNCKNDINLLNGTGNY